MNKHNNKTKRAKIEEYLQSGMSPREVIEKKGFAKSTVYQVVRQRQSRIPAESQEVEELTKKKAILKLKSDIEDMESKREKLLGRIEHLEKQMAAIGKELDKELSEIWPLLFMLQEIMDTLRDDKLSDEELTKLEEQYNRTWGNLTQVSDAIKNA
jgi:transposase